MPHTNSERATSLAISDRFSTADQRGRYSDELRSRRKLSLSFEVFSEALELLKDAQVAAMFGAAPPAPASPRAAPRASRPPAPSPRAAASAVPTSPPPPIAPTPRYPPTALHKSPFAILGATTRDDRKRIIELADHRSLDLDHEACQQARSALTNPRTRLCAEVAWLPGVSPRKTCELLQALLQDPATGRNEPGLPVLAHLNVLAAVFESVSTEHDAADLSRFILGVASLVEFLDPEEVMRHINEDRAVSGFPEVRDVHQVDTELADRRRYYRNAIKDAVDRLPSATLIRVMTSVAEGATEGGERHAPSLVDDLVDVYEMETRSLLQTGSSHIEKLIETARHAAPSGDVAVNPLVSKIDAAARNWDRLAQPIQLCAKARGTRHEPSDLLAWAIRSLAIDLFNKHGLLAQSQGLTGLLQEIFAEVPEVAERLEQDAGALRDIAERRSEAAAVAPIRRLCEEVLKCIERDPDAANEQGQRLLNEGVSLLKSTHIGSPGDRESQDMLAATLMRCAVAYGNKTSRWAPCVLLLERAVELAVEPKLRAKLLENLSVVKTNQAVVGDLKPLERAPGLFGNWYVAAIVLGALALFGLSRLSTTARPTTPAFSAPAQAPPGNGAKRASTSAQAVAPFTIQTASGGYYLVRLEDATYRTHVLDVFVHGGRTVKVSVPLGSYLVKYASGGTWYGEQYLFGPDTRYSKAGEVFHFRDEGHRVTGYTITLYQVRNGNLSTRSIGAAEF